MKLVEKALLYRQRAVAAPVTWASYVAALALPAWWRCRDTSGVTVVNSGSLGSAVDLTAIAWTMAQTGKLGAGEAGLTDGATTRLQCANVAGLSALTTWEFFFLVNPSSAGEGNLGCFFVWGNGTNEPVCQFNTALSKIFVNVANTTPANFVTQTSSGIAQNAWSLVFIAYDDSGDRKPHIRIGASGAVSEPAYSAQAAMTGTYRLPTSPLNLLNTTAQGVTFAGLMDEAGIIGGRTFTPPERLQMTVLAGV